MNNHVFYSLTKIFSKIDPQEKKVICLFHQGKTYADIAQEAYISKTSAWNLIEALKNKTGAENDTQLRNYLTIFMTKTNCPCESSHHEDLFLNN